MCLEDVFFSICWLHDILVIFKNHTKFLFPLFPKFLSWYVLLTYSLVKHISFLRWITVWASLFEKPVQETYDYTKAPFLLDWFSGTQQKYVIIFSKAHHPLSFTLQTSEKNNLSIYTIFTKYLRDLKGSTENTINFGPFKIYEIHVWMWQLNYKESWRLKNWCFWTVVLEKTLESPLDC